MRPRLNWHGKGRQQGQQSFMSGASVIYINPDGGPALCFADRPQHLVYLAMADLDGLHGGRHCLRAVQQGRATWL